MGWKNTAAIAGIFACLSLQAKIIDIQTTKEAIQEADADTLMIFDLDNTIVMPAQTIGGEEWFDYLVKKYQGTLFPVQAIEKALLRWNRIMQVTDVIPAEKNGRGEIAAKQAIGAKAMALTARPISLAKTTDKHLKRIKVDLSSSPVWKSDLDFKTASPSGYRNGVVYVGALNKKGDILNQFLKATGLAPKKIIFVDNKRHHVENVEKSLARGIHYIGARLGATDAKIAAFDEAVADVQDYYFGNPLGDDEARELLKAGFPAARP